MLVYELFVVVFWSDVCVSEKELIKKLTLPKQKN